MVEENKEESNAEETGPVINFTEPVEPDLGKLALVVSQLQSEVITQGRQLTMLINQFTMLDRAVHSRLTNLEKAAGIPSPGAVSGAGATPGPRPRPENTAPPRIIKPSNNEVGPQ